MAEPETHHSDQAGQQTPQPPTPPLERPERASMAARFRVQQLARADAQARLRKAVLPTGDPAPPHAKSPPTEQHSPLPEQQQKPQPEPEPRPEPGPKPPLDLPTVLQHDQEPAAEQKPASEIPIAPTNFDPAPESEPFVTTATPMDNKTQPAEPHPATDHPDNPTPAMHPAAEPEAAAKVEVAPDNRAENGAPAESPADPLQAAPLPPSSAPSTTPATTPLHFRVTTNSTSPTDFALGPGRYVLGRSDEADLTVRAPSVSRRHLCFDVRPHRCTVEDVGSTNGTIVNGERIMGIRTLHTRDRIQLGDVLLDVSMAPEP